MRGRRPVRGRLAHLVGAMLLAAGPVGAADVDGDGRADLVWRDPSGLLKVWHLVDGSVVESAPFPPPSDAEFLGLADVDGDGRGELLWTLGHDQLMASPLDGIGADRWLGPLPPGQRLLGWADVDGDGRAEALVLADGSRLEVWRADPLLTLVGVAGSPPAGADLVTAADVDGDGTADLLWQLRGGELLVWRMAGTPTGSVVVGQLAPEQRVAGLVDVDGNGHADLVVEAVDGAVEVWLLDGGHRLGGGPVGNWGALYHVPLVGDLDGDGRADVVLRHLDGAATAWLLDGVAVSSELPLPLLEPPWQAVRAEPGPRLRFAATSVPNWFLPALADLDGDGWLDALGARNLGAGVMEAVAADAIGLGAVFAGGRAFRDARVADLDGDGRLDVIANTYSAVTDPSRALLFIGGGDGTFVEDPGFAALDIRGYGETIVVADFDNDGDLDIFIPYYAFLDPLVEQSYLLINDGAGRFTDVADAAGVALRGVPLGRRPEGAQAVDLDGDGWIDLYVASRLFRNNGDLTFTDVREAAGLPEQFEEGAKFLDWNQDGRLDLVLMDFVRGPRLFEHDGTRFRHRHAFPPRTYRSSFGLNVADLDGDGREDVISGGTGCDQRVRIHLNTGARMVPAVGSAADPCGVLVAAGDLDGDHHLDLAVTEFSSLGPRLWTLLNRTSASGSWFVVEAVGPGGEQNQHGRVIRAWPVSRPDFVMTRVVDGGSGYLSQGPYPVLFRTPFLEKHVVQVGFASGVTHVAVMPGETVRLGPPGRLGPPPGVTRAQPSGPATGRRGAIEADPIRWGLNGTDR